MLFSPFTRYNFENFFTSDQTIFQASSKLYYKKFADETDRESSFSQRRSLVVGDGPVKGDGVGVLVA